MVDRNRTTIDDLRIGFMDLEALSLKDELDSEEINKLIDYIKPLMNSTTNRNTINKDKLIFYFNKLLTSRGIKIQNCVLMKKKVYSNWTKHREYAATAINFLLCICSYMKK